MDPIAIAFDVLAFAAFVAEGFAFVDALRRPSQAFVAAGKKPKAFWLAIIGTSAVVGLGYAVYVGGMSVLSLFPVAAFVAAAIYLTDVRPAIRQLRGGGSRPGPYGPW